MRALIVAVALAAAHCGPPSPPAPTPTNATCADACATLERIGCEEAQPTDEGATCVEVCENAGDLPLACLAGADSCVDAEACE